MKVGLPVTLVYSEYRWCEGNGPTHMNDIKQKVALASAIRVTFLPFAGHVHVHKTAISKCAIN